MICRNSLHTRSRLSMLTAAYLRCKVSVHSENACQVPSTTNRLEWKFSPTAAVETFGLHYTTVCRNIRLLIFARCFYISRQAFVIVMMSVRTSEDLTWHAIKSISAWNYGLVGNVAVQWYEYGIWGSKFFNELLWRPYTKFEQIISPQCCFKAIKRRLL